MAQPANRRRNFLLELVEERLMIFSSNVVGTVDVKSCPIRPMRPSALEIEDNHQTMWGKGDWLRCCRLPRRVPLYCRRRRRRNAAAPRRIVNDAGSGTRLTP